MSSCLRIVIGLALVAAAATQSPAAENNAEQDAAIAAIKKMNGSVDIDPRRPGKPVIRVHLFEGKTAGIGLAPLAKLPELEWIGLHASDITEADLDYLKGLTKLNRLGLVNTHLNDDSLKRLEGITTLQMLYLAENPITDAGLDHLQRMTKLTELDLGETKITDAGLERLTAFKDLQILRLAHLSITEAGLKRLKALTKLQKLDLNGCVKVRDLSALEGLPLTSLNLQDCRQVHDLRPLAAISLSELFLTPKNFTPDNLEALRQCKTLKTIVIGYHPSERLSATDFWKKFDAGELKP